LCSPIGDGDETDDHGRFSEKDRPPGNYCVSASLGEQNYYCDTIYFEVTDRDVTDLRVKLYRGAVFRGELLVEGTTADSRLVDLAAFLGPGQHFDTIVSESGSGGARSFEINQMCGGRWTIQVRPAPVNDGWTVVRVERGGMPIDNLIEVEPDGRLTGGLEVKAGETIDNLRVFVTHGNGVIRGRLKIEGGELPQGLMIFIQCRQNNRLSGFISEAELDSVGQFELRDLIPGDYELSLYSPNLTTRDSAIISQLKKVKQTVSVRNDNQSSATLILGLTSNKKD
jgi:hypothetical protein